MPICNKEIKLKDVAKVCPPNQRSLERWVAAYRKDGKAGLKPKSTRSRTNLKETPIRIKERILELRKNPKTKKCALKLKEKPAQNDKVERSHRTDQEMFYERNKFKTLKDLETKIKIWNEEYNNLEHCGLNGKTSNEMLKLLSTNEPPNVYV